MFMNLTSFNYFNLLIKILFDIDEEDIIFASFLYFLTQK